MGENAGMKLNDEGGIEIYIATEKPADLPVATIFSAVTDSMALH